MFFSTNPEMGFQFRDKKAMHVWEAIGREEKLVALINSMHKTGIGFREVEESVQRLEDTKWSSKVSKGI